jgi:CIC family chloride channel protein
MLTRTQMISAARSGDPHRPLATDGHAHPQSMSPFQTLRTAAMQMAESNLTSYPVLSVDGKLLGVLTINDLLKGRSQQAIREGTRQRVLRLRWPFGPGQPVAPSTATIVDDAVLDAEERPARRP